jgi:hypothetical protein
VRRNDSRQGCHALTVGAPGTLGPPDFARPGVSIRVGLTSEGGARRRSASDPLSDPQLHHRVQPGFHDFGVVTGRWVAAVRHDDRKQIAFGVVGISSVKSGRTAASLMSYFNRCDRNVLPAETRRETVLSQPTPTGRRRCAHGVPAADRSGCVPRPAAVEAGSVSACKSEISIESSTICRSRSTELGDLLEPAHGGRSG